MNDRPTAAASVGSRVPPPPLNEVGFLARLGFPPLLSRRRRDERAAAWAASKDQLAQMRGQHTDVLTSSETDSPTKSEPNPSASDIAIWSLLAADGPRAPRKRTATPRAAGRSLQPGDPSRSGGRIPIELEVVRSDPSATRDFGRYLSVRSPSSVAQKTRALYRFKLPPGEAGRWYHPILWTGLAPPTGGSKSEPAITGNSTYSRETKGPPHE